MIGQEPPCMDKHVWTRFKGCFYVCENRVTTVIETKGEIPAFSYFCDEHSKDAWSVIHEDCCEKDDKYGQER